MLSLVLEEVQVTKFFLQCIAGFVLPWAHHLFVVEGVHGKLIQSDPDADYLEMVDQ